MKQTTEEKKQIRLSRVLELYSEGRTERDIAKVLGVSPATVHRDLVELREEAVNSIKDHIVGIPFQFERCLTSYDALLRRASSLLDSNDIDKLALIKLIANLQKTRLELHSAPVVLQKAVEYTKSLQAKIEALERDQRKGAGYQVVQEIHSIAGQPDRIVRKALKKQALKKESEAIV
jgi:DNA-binding transcriptional regulator LsrR (DeoR family)